MKHSGLTFLHLLVLSCLILLSGCQTDITLSTPSGKITGNIQDQHVEFLGIPYAQPPLGNLRWQPPVALPAFSTSYSANEFKNACPQFAQMNSIFTSSEDCLFLNIWRPLNENKDLPVMVYIHGGGLATGAGSESRYNGQTLAINQNVIVVSINYRLGYLGYLSLPELTQEQGHSGNYGFLDQNLALSWINENISSFGGNPNQITLFGESAGANSTCLHLASPLSQGLFNNAILQSHGLYSSCANTLPSQSQAEKQGSTFAQIVNCETNTLSCLREKSIFNLNFTLLMKGLKSGPIHASPALALHPVIDHYFLTQQPLRVFQQGQIRDKSILMGVNKNEGTLFASFDEELTSLNDYILALKTRYPEKHEQVANLYPYTSYANGNAALADVIGDETFVCRSLLLADTLTKGGSDVYFYYFTPVINSHMKSIVNLFGGNGIDLGTFHASEVPYVFGVESIFGKLDDTAQGTSKIIQQYWGEFSASNNPNSTQSPYIWPTYQPSTQQVLVLNTELSVKENLKKEKCQLFL